jgi:hypothetical protein
MTPGGAIVSHHRFTRPGIRVWLPVLMMFILLACGWVAAPQVGVLEVVGLLLVLYVTVSALVSVCEITVTEDGLLINRLLLRKRFLPWNAIDRVIVFSHTGGGPDTHIEMASIGVYEGLSPLNRLPGLVYGQGFRQTIMVTPDAIEDYDVLMAALEAHCPIYWR